LKKRYKRFTDANGEGGQVYEILYLISK